MVGGLVPVSRYRFTSNESYIASLIYSHSPLVWLRACAIRMCAFVHLAKDRLGWIHTSNQIFR